MFFGFSHREMMEMPEKTFNEYWMAITQIEAQETLKSMEVSDWPHLDKQPRRIKSKKLYKLAYPEQEGKYMTLSELESKLKG